MSKNDAGRSGQRVFALPEWAICLLALILTGVAQFGFRFIVNRKLAVSK
jgi:hypothetical protein